MCVWDTNPIGCPWWTYVCAISWNFDSSLLFELCYLGLTAEFPKNM